jgi:hypothetical protein
MNYDSHYELPHGGTVSIDFGDAEGHDKKQLEQILVHAVKEARYENDR